jgi:hypothetical protein
MTIAALRAIQDEARLSTAQILENAQFLIPTALPDAIAARLGTTMEAIEKHLLRAGHPDLAMPFNNAMKIERRRQARLAQQGHVDLWCSVTDLVHRGDHVQVHLRQEMPVTVVGGADAGMSKPA